MRLLVIKFVIINVEIIVILKIKTITTRKKRVYAIRGKVPFPIR